MAVTWRKVAYADESIPLSTITAGGSILYGTAAGAIAELAIGTDGFVLNVATDIPGWINPTSLAVALHATTHKNGGGDELLLSDFGEPDGAVAFAGQQATNLVIHKATSAPTAVLGKWYWDNEDAAVYLCTSIA